MNRIAFLMPVLNCERTIGEAIAAIGRQVNYSGQIKLVISDQESDDDTKKAALDAVQKLPRHFEVSFTQTKRRTKEKSMLNMNFNLNNAVQVCKRNFPEVQFAVMASGDNILEPAFLFEHQLIWRRKPYGYISSRQTRIMPDSNSSCHLQPMGSEFTGPVFLEALTGEFAKNPCTGGATAFSLEAWELFQTVDWTVPVDLILPVCGYFAGGVFNIGIPLTWFETSKDQTGLGSLLLLENSEDRLKEMHTKCAIEHPKARREIDRLLKLHKKEPGDFASPGQGAANSDRVKLPAGAVENS